MFISKREAEERLSEDRNIFRDPSSATSVNNSSGARRDDGDSLSESECEDDLQTEVETPEVGGVDAIGRMNGKAGASLTSEGSSDKTSLSLSQLDDLLHPRIHGRAQYRGKLESQVAIAQTELIIGQTATSRAFQLSDSQTVAYSRGLRSTGDITTHTPPKPELTSRINKIKEELAEKAAARLDLTLDALSASKIGEIKRATNLSKVAKDMAVILDKCTENKEDSSKGVHFHIFVPDPVDIDRYPIVNVGPAVSSTDKQV